MTDQEPSEPRPPRRPRYSGANPRHFHQKYKEHQPERYADDVAKVIAGGRTPAGTHRAIMVAEVLEALRLKPGDVVVDCTLGHGGHAQLFLEAIQPGGRLLGLDVDPIELPKTESRLRDLGHPPESLVVRRTNYAATQKFLAEECPEGADVIFADLGLSSMQVDDPSRGFTYKADGPLDMRMNPGRGVPASEWLSTIDVPAFAALLAANADEPRPQALADAILSAHRRYPLNTTRALADVVYNTVARRQGDRDAATIRRVFQAIRIAVNDEFGALENLLRHLPACLKPGGRVAILTFHSGEDRRVKLAFKEGLREGVYASVARELGRPTAEERRANPRSSAAKLRSAVRAS